MKRKKKYEVSIPQQSFPSTYVSDSKRKTPEFGLQIGRAIQHAWFQPDSGKVGGRFFSQWNELNRRRRYALGKQSLSKYKDELSVDGDLSYLNLNWDIVPIIPKFVDILANGMADRLFKVRAYGYDESSTVKRNMYRETKEKDMVARPILEHVEDLFGVNVFATDQESLPQSEEELSLDVKLNYKDSMEMAAETVVETLMEDEKYHRVRKRTLYNQVVYGMGVEHREFRKGDTIRVRSCNPLDMVYSEVDDPHFKDAFYFGEILTVPITELTKINEGLTRDDLEDISEHAFSWYNQHKNTAYYQNTVFNKDYCTIINFAYKTTKKIVHKIKDGVKAIQKEDDWNPPAEMMEERNFERTEKEVEVWYQGSMVLGTDILLKWEEVDNIPRDKKTGQRAISPYVACAPRLQEGFFESIVSRTEPMADLFQLAHLKMQQVIQKIVPDGVFIDADGLNEVDLGNGAKYNPSEALKLFFQTGSVVGRSYTGDGEYNHAKIPIQELNHNSGQQKIQSLIMAQNRYLQMITDVTGLNSAVDASDPDPKALVGVQKMAALNSNTATRHILEASLEMSQDMAEGLLRSFQEAIQHPDHREDLINKVGRYNVELISDIGGLNLHDFSIYLELAPDAEEKAELERSISIALERQNIDLDDAIDVRAIKNVKLANQLLKLRKKQREQKRMRQEAAKAQMQAQINSNAQQMAAQIKAQEIEMKKNADIETEQAKIAFEINKLREEAGLKMQLMDREFSYNQQLHGMTVAERSRMEKEKEDRKDRRIDKQSENTSKIQEQKMRGLGAQKFESNEDSLDGFRLSEFEPR